MIECGDRQGYVADDASAGVLYGILNTKLACPGRQYRGQDEAAEVTCCELLEKAAGCFQAVRGPGQKAQRSCRLAYRLALLQALGQFRMGGQFGDDEPLPDHVPGGSAGRGRGLRIQRGHPRADGGQPLSGCVTQFGNPPRKISAASASLLAPSNASAAIARPWTAADGGPPPPQSQVAASARQRRCSMGHQHASQLTR